MDRITEIRQFMEKYWASVAAQDADEMKKYFRPDAWIKWQNTNELFTVEEFIRANCEYPGQWCGGLERLETAGETLITVVRVWTKDRSMSFHVTSFFSLDGDKIVSVDEYWGDDGPAPQWRLDKKIGAKIRA